MQPGECGYVLGDCSLETVCSFQSKGQERQARCLAMVIVLRLSVDSISESASISQKGNWHLFSML